jgi:hypothetical protein
VSLPEHLRSLLERSDRLGIDSVHADRLRKRVHSVYGHGDLYAEMVEEMASALGRTASRVDAAILECEIQARQAGQSPGDSAAVAAYEAAREKARRARRDLFIHREALGLFDHRPVEQAYPIPPAWAFRGRTSGQGD